MQWHYCYVSRENSLAGMPCTRTHSHMLPLMHNNYVSARWISFFYMPHWNGEHRAHILHRHKAHVRANIHIMYVHKSIFWMRGTSRTGHGSWELGGVCVCVHVQGEGKREQMCLESEQSEYCNTPSTWYIFHTKHTHSSHTYYCRILYINYMNVGVSLRTGPYGSGCTVYTHPRTHPCRVHTAETSTLCTLKVREHRSTIPKCCYFNHKKNERKQWNDCVWNKQNATEPRIIQNAYRQYMLPIRYRDSYALFLPKCSKIGEQKGELHLAVVHTRARTWKKNSHSLRVPSHTRSIFVHLRFDLNMSFFLFVLCAFLFSFQIFIIMNIMMSEFKATLFEWNVLCLCVFIIMFASYLFIIFQYRPIFWSLNDYGVKWKETRKSCPFLTRCECTKSLSQIHK